MGNKQSIRNEERSSSDEGNGLTYYQIQAIQRAWRHMSKAGQVSCGRQIITKIYKNNTEIRNIFQTYVTIENLSINQMEPVEWGVLKHGEEIVNLLDYVIKNLNNIEMVEEKCEEVGRSHRKMKQYGMKEEHWDSLGEALSETIRENYGWKKNRQLLKASNILASFVVDRIRTGFIQKDGNETRISMKFSTPRKDELKKSNFKRYNSIANGELCIKDVTYSPINKKNFNKHNNIMIRAKSMDGSVNPRRRVLPGIPFSEIIKIEQRDSSSNFQRKNSTVSTRQYNKQSFFNGNRPCLCSFINDNYDFEGNIIKYKEGI
uniref:GLOBIN domain-containing protein n=1 Tax=Parastrongyloides trichosuri TaxID=131310 RepID=A0A0N4ZKI8_PARTI